MSRGAILSLFIVVTISLSVSCSPQASPTPVLSMPNPASVYCEEHGGRLEIRQDAAGGQVGICVFPDGSECDEWAYFRGECAPAGSMQTESPDPVPTAFPTPIPINPDDYQNWITYTHPVDGFSLLLPDDWMVDEPTSGSPLDGHILLIHPKEAALGQNIRMTFRYVGEDVLLWPTGAGEGNFIELGTLEIAGDPARRVLLVCPNGQVDSIYYHGQTDANILRENMEFAFLFSAGDTHCGGTTLSGKDQLVGEMIIASLLMPY